MRERSTIEMSSKKTGNKAKAKTKEDEDSEEDIKKPKVKKSSTLRSKKSSTSSKKEKKTKSKINTRRKTKKNNDDEESEKKHIEFYILELSVKPGGSRKHVMHVHTSLTTIYRVLQQDLIEDASLAIWYGEEIILHRCLNYKVIESIDLHPYITYYVGEFPPIKFDDDNDVIGFKKSSVLGHDPMRADPIDFDKLKLDEVYRYLLYDTYEIFRIMEKEGIVSSNMDRYPPNVGVQIDLSNIPRIKDVSHYRDFLKDEKDTMKIKFPVKRGKIELHIGENDFGG